MTIKIKRVYETPARGDGYRILVDRLWPRGLSKPVAQVDQWLKEVAPTAELRRWFGHTEEKWAEFRRRYFKELDARPELVDPIRERARSSPVTLLFGSRETKLNNAVALKEYLERRGTTP